MDENSGKPDTSSAVRFGLLLRSAQHLLAQQIDEVLQPLDLNLGMWRVLLEVEREPGASASELARASFHTPQTLSGLLRRLEDRGLVERSMGRGRIVENHLTRAGHEALASATQRADQVIAASLAAFNPADRAGLQRLLAEYAGMLTRNQPPAPPA
ncbi:MarR family winged helix-turn-helix transcriptional regulator [Catenulispora pinisilvae]|uniref:MarR family winged helix-turn-helix transcriptional regulator n=1 Tax=Catenulispora pinisilvae TaxID=2705253 RepID=UPI0018913918|nr:MarR family transcriptional regulator [Catenulispora pinisilvae]